MGCESSAEITEDNWSVANSAPTPASQVKPAEAPSQPEPQPAAEEAPAAQEGNKDEDAPPERSQFEPLEEDLELVAKGSPKFQQMQQLYGF